MERDKNKLIEEKQAKIKELQKELRELKGGKSFMEYMEEDSMYDDSYSDRFTMKPLPRCYGRWDLVRKLCTVIHGQGVRVKDISTEQRMLSANMADEIVRIFNRYVELASKERGE